MVDSFSAYNIAAAALLALTAIPTVVIFLCSLCLARRRKDPARSWLALCKAAYGFFVLSTLLFVFYYVLAVLYEQLVNAAQEEDAMDVINNIFRAEDQMAIIGNLFDTFAIIFALVTLLSLALAADLIHAGNQSFSDKMLLLGAHGLAGVLGILNIVVFAIKEREYSLTYGNSGFFNSFALTNTDWDLVKTVNNITFALLVIELVFNLAVLVKAIMVAAKTRAEPRVTTATRYLIVCCTLLLLKTSYNVGYWVKYVPLGDPQNAQPPQPGDYFAIIDVVLNFWPMLVIFVILFALGAKKQYGVWSTEQEFMMVRPAEDGMTTQQTPWGYGYSAPAQPPVAPGWEQHQHQQYQQYPQAYDPHELSPQHAAAHAPQFRHEVPSQQPWREVPEQYHNQPYEMSVQTGSTSPPPPSHFESMGLNHQADGTPPQTTPQPYQEKH